MGRDVIVHILLKMFFIFCCNPDNVTYFFTILNNLTYFFSSFWPFILSREVTGESDLLPGVTGAMGGHSAWLQGLKSPLIKEDEGSGSKELKLRFDVSEYAPEEIMVKTVDNKLLVHAKHEETGSGKSIYREYNREFLLPHGTNPELIKSSLSKVYFLKFWFPI